MSRADPAGSSSPAHRVIEGHAVNLVPLFHWWTNRQGERPLAAWVHVSGSVTGTNTLGWVISGQAERASLPTSDPDTPNPVRPPAQQFILKNPPSAQAAEFYRLRAQLQQVTAQRAQLQSEETNAKNEESQAQRANRGRNRNRTTAQLRQVERADNNLIKQLDQQISGLQKKLAAYPSGERFSVDAFALDTGTQYSHLPIFDHGLGLK